MDIADVSPTATLMENITLTITDRDGTVEVTTWHTMGAAQSYAATAREYDTDNEIASITV